MAYQLSNIYIITAFLVIGGLLQGFDISSLSAILSTKPFKEEFDSPTADQQGGITASISGGSFLGCLVNIFVVDRFGRRRTLMAGCVIFVIGAIICAASVDIAMLIVGRLLCDLECRVIHFYSTVVPCGAIAPRNKRPHS
jgi:MFS family permease